jgi:hypothetical protein
MVINPFISGRQDYELFMATRSYFPYGWLLKMATETLLPGLLLMVTNIPISLMALVAKMVTHS